MKASSLSEVKKELSNLSNGELSDLLIRLCKYKKDNKEYLSYLMFDAHNREEVIQGIKLELDVHFEALKSQQNLYFVKKSLRKILRILNRYVKYIDDKAAAAELHIYFCRLMKNSGIKYQSSKLIVNLYDQELKKINGLIHSLHEDLRADFEFGYSELC